MKSYRFVFAQEQVEMPVLARRARLGMSVIVELAAVPGIARVAGRVMPPLFEARRTCQGQLDHAAAALRGAQRDLHGIQRGLRQRVAIVPSGHRYFFAAQGLDGPQGLSPFLRFFLAGPQGFSGPQGLPAFALDAAGAAMLAVGATGLAGFAGSAAWAGCSSASAMARACKAWAVVQAALRWDIFLLIALSPHTKRVEFIRPARHA